MAQNPVLQKSKYLSKDKAFADKVGVNKKDFKSRAKAALHNKTLQDALGNLESGFVQKRASAVAALPEFDALRDKAVEIKNHTLEHLDIYLEKFEERVVHQGGEVHWCRTAEDARARVLAICQDQAAKKVIKGKSMIAEEIALNPDLEAAGLEVIESDLGEYIIQIRREAPSHIIAPAIHLNRQQIAKDFKKRHREFPDDRSLDSAQSLVQEAREVLRDQYLSADVGITGANFLIAESGSSIIVTNEGNGDLGQIFPKTHIVIASIEKLIPTLEDAAVILRILARSATGQEMSAYTTIATGPKRPEDLDGPEAYHVILLDNGRSQMLGGEFQDMLRCIRCGACLNHCPVYQAVGGHAYGGVYPGPMGSVLSPALNGIEKTRDLPNASTLCGRCEEVCPMRIPLPKMLRHWREEEFSRHLTPQTARFGLGVWAYFATRPRAYRFAADKVLPLLRLMGGKSGRIKALPFLGAWTKSRDFPAPQGKSFLSQYADYQITKIHEQKKSQ